MIRQKLSGPNLRVIINALFACFYTIPMIYFSPLLSIVGLLIAAGGLVLSVWAVVKNLEINTKILDLQGETNALVFQCLFGISKVRIAGAENVCFALWEKLFYKIKKLQWPLELVNNGALLGNFAVSSLSQLVLYAVAFYMVQNQIGTTLSVGSFIAFLSAYIPFSYAINSLCTSLLDICASLNTWKRSAPIFNEPPETDESKTKPEKLSGRVRIDHASFRYHEEDPLTLDDVSLRADPGEFIAIVGASGSGKSTLIKLLVGFETPQSGAIYYDNIDMATLNMRELRSQLGIVLQTSKLMSASIEQNIRANGFYTLEEINEAFALAQFDVVLKKLPMGLETQLINEGEILSGGERQRLIIAKALIGKPKILIFDEATSALDNKTQDVMTRNLDKLNITRIVIAHRLSTLQRADRIYVFDHGKIVEEGSFDDLLKKEGYFHHLLTKQRFE